MKQKEILENLTGEKFPEPTPQETKRHNIPNSPFWHIENKEGHWLIMGKYRMNNTPFTTADELHTWMNDHKWNIMLSMAICTATDIITNQNKQ